MPQIINNTRRAVHLPRKHRDGEDPFVEAKDENGKRIKVPNESESFGGDVMVPAATTHPKTMEVTPGALDRVPAWYLEQLVKEKGWRKRFERGGGFEVEGRDPLPAGSEKHAASERKLHDKLLAERDRADAEHERARDLAKRNTELEAELAKLRAAAPKSDAPKEGSAPAKDAKPTTK